MSRIYNIGWETNSLTNGVEANSMTVTNGGGASIQTGTVRTGTYALKLNPPTSTGDNIRVTNSSSHSQFIRVYLNIATYPTAADNSFVSIRDSTETVTPAFISINTNGTLELVYGDNAGGFSAVGASSVLSLNTWYMIELHVDDTAGFASTLVEGRLNGSVFATRTGQIVVTGNGGIPNGFTHFGDQLIASNTTGVWYLEDIAINDGAGTSQNSYPGAGALTMIRPNAAGDINTFATQTGGTAGASNNFTRVNELPPDDATSFNGSSTLNQEDLFKNTDSFVNPHTISVVQVMARYRNNTADATTAFKIECEKIAGGTITQGAAIVPNSTTWTTVSPANSLMLYNDPDGNPWGKSTATMQIGYKLTTANVNRIEVTSVWAYIDHAPSMPTTFRNPYQIISRPRAFAPGVAR